MDDNTEWLADAKNRLAAPQASKRRKGSIAGKVEALRPEIEAARKARKNWKQIAADISGGEELNADAVRIALGRIQKLEPFADPVNVDESKQPALADTIDNSSLINSVDAPKPADGSSETPLPDEGLFGEMFAPMFDARDTRGRGCDEASNEGDRP